MREAALLLFFGGVLSIRQVQVWGLHVDPRGDDPGAAGIRRRIHFGQCCQRRQREYVLVNNDVYPVDGANGTERDEDNYKCCDNSRAACRRRGWWQLWGAPNTHRKREICGKRICATWWSIGRIRSSYFTAAKHPIR